MCHLTKSVAERYASKLQTVELENFTSPHYLALFASQEAGVFLEQLASEFAEEVKKFGVEMKPYNKQLHLSLAYKYHPQNKDRLQKLASGSNLFHATVL